MEDLTCVVCLVKRNSSGGVSDAETVYLGYALCKEHLDAYRRADPHGDVFEILGHR